MYCRNYTGTVSRALHRVFLLCPYLGESTIRGFTVLVFFSLFAFNQ